MVDGGWQRNKETQPRLDSTLTAVTFLDCGPQLLLLLLPLSPHTGVYDDPRALTRSPSLPVLRPLFVLLCACCARRHDNINQHRRRLTLLSRESDMGEPAAVPSPDADEAYAGMVDRMDALEQRVMSMEMEGGAEEEEEEEDHDARKRVASPSLPVG